MSGDPQRLGTSRNYRLTETERHLLSLLLIEAIQKQCLLPDDQRQPGLFQLRALLERFTTD